MTTKKTTKNSLPDGALAVSPWLTSQEDKLRSTTTWACGTWAEWWDFDTRNEKARFVVYGKKPKGFDTLRVHSDWGTEFDSIEVGKAKYWMTTMCIMGNFLKKASKAKTEAGLSYPTVLYVTVEVAPKTRAKSTR